MRIFCKMSNWRRSDFMSGRVSMSQQYYMNCHHHRLSDVKKTTISLLYELVNFRDNYLVFTDDFNFNLIVLLCFGICVCYLMYTFITFACALICTTVRVS